MEKNLFLLSLMLLVCLNISAGGRIEIHQIQNTDLENPQYVFAGKVRAGYNVDSGRTRGDVTVKSGADYEIEASGEVFLGGGFSVERGASFSVMPSTYR